MIRDKQSLIATQLIEGSNSSIQHCGGSEHIGQPQESGWLWTKRTFYCISLLGPRAATTPAEDKTVSWDENHVRGMRKMSTDSLKYVEKPS